jgi:hypothetical protein
VHGACWQHDGSARGKDGIGRGNCFVICGIVVAVPFLGRGVCQIFCARDFFLSGTRCLSGTLSSRYLMSLCPFYSAGPGNRTFRAVPGLMLRVPVFFPSCSFRAPLPCPCRITWRLLPCVT